MRNATAVLLREVIHERTGIYFHDGSLDLMMDKISSLLVERGLDSLLDYYYLLKYDTAGADEWVKLIDAISVRETYFWREFDQIRAMVETVLPQIAGKSTGPIRVWSAACASGEEPLSIAMALDRAGWFQPGRVPIEICASDASSAALRSAKAGVYRERSFRNLPPEVWNKYFDRTTGGWKVDPSIQQRIQWRRANLTEESEIYDLARAQIVFCRNVFIYFSDATIRKAVKLFERYMPRPSYLFLGSAESLLKFTNEFELEEIGGAFAYIKA